MNGQTRVISGMKKREASSRNLHIVKNINESLRWLTTVSNTFQGVDFDGSFLPLFIT